MDIMRITITGKNIELTDGLKEAVTERLSKLEKYFAPETLEKDTDDDDEIRIIRTKRFGIKPMYPEDACVQMELLGHDFFVFLNAETEEVNVVYKRKGNTYGLIEPEF